MTAAVQMPVALRKHRRGAAACAGHHTCWHYGHLRVAWWPRRSKRTGTRLSFFQYMLGLVATACAYRPTLPAGKVVYGVAVANHVPADRRAALGIRLINSWVRQAACNQPEARRRVLVVGAAGAARR